MIDLARISIGGLCLRVCSEQPVRLSDCHTEDYRAFRRGADLPPADDLRLLIDTVSPPSTAGMQPLFDNEPSWSVLSDNGKRRQVVLRHPATNELLWSMQIERGSKEVIVYCGPKMVLGNNGSTEVINPVAYPLDLVLMMYALAERNGVVIHAAGIELNGRGFLFPGVSGAGKSTLSRLFADDNRAVRLSDDRIIVRNIDGGLRMFGTPWLGEAGVCADGSAPLSAILFLRKSATNNVGRLDAKETVESLLPVVSVPWYDRELIPSIMATCEAIVSRTPAYSFGFTPTADAVAFLETFQH